MGLSDRPYYHDHEAGSLFAPSGRTMVINLIIINAVIFVLDTFIIYPVNPRYGLIEMFAVQSDTIWEPWTWWRFLTYGFIHSRVNPFHVIGNIFDTLTFVIRRATRPCNRS